MLTFRAALSDFEVERCQEVSFSLSKVPNVEVGRWFAAVAAQTDADVIVRQGCVAVLHFETVAHDSAHKCVIVIENNVEFIVVSDSGQWGEGHLFWLFERIDTGGVGRNFCATSAGVDAYG